MSSNVTLSDTKARPGRALHVSLWIVQILLAILFGVAGFMKSTMPIPALAQKLAWVGSAPAVLVRFIGFSELAAAFGLILPAAFRTMPRLTPLAASGLVAIMILAGPFHIQRGEANLIGVPLVLGTLAAFVAWGRFRAVPIEARG